MNFKKFSNNIINITLLANGWRGNIYTAIYNGEKIVIKVPKREEVDHTTAIEVENLNLLQDFSFVPKLVIYGDDFFAYSFIEGIHLSDALNKLEQEKNILPYKKILLSILGNLYKLDTVGLFKKELIRCTKNFIVSIDYSIVTMIDFERSRTNIFNKNIPQFLQFLKSKKIFTLEETIELGEKYGKDRKIIYEFICNKINVLEDFH